MAAAPRAAPHVGFGLYKVAPPDCYAITQAALRAGYRHVDTAQFYGNEAETGAAVRDFLAEHPGERVHVTTKVWPLTASLPPGQALARVRASIVQSQAALGVPVDTLLLHAPGAGGLTRDETWRAMEEAVARGVVKELGVSNFGQAHLEHLLARCAVAPRVNQIEVHPWLQRRDLVAWCKAHDITVEAYSPLAKARCLDDPVLAGVARRAAGTPAQVLLAWSLAKGLTPLVKSSNPARQRENLRLLELSAADTACLDNLERGLTTGWDPCSSHPVL